MQWGGGKTTSIPELLPEETRESPSKRFLRTGFRSTSARNSSSCSCLEAGSEMRAFSLFSFSHNGPVGAPRRKSHLCSSENKQKTWSKINPTPIQPTKHPQKCSAHLYLYYWYFQNWSGSSSASGSWRRSRSTGHASLGSNLETTREGFVQASCFTVKYKQPSFPPSRNIRAYLEE